MNGHKCADTKINRIVIKCIPKGKLTEHDVCVYK